MDTNAGGGLRGTRATLTADLTNLLSDKYGFDKSTKYRDIGGSSSLNLHAITKHGQYIARIYRPYVSTTRFNDILRVRRQLIANGLPCSTTLETFTGDEHTYWNGRIVEVEHYIKHDDIMDKIDRLKYAMPIFGKMTSILSNIDNISTDAKNPLFSNHIHFEKIAKMTEKGCRRMLSWNPTEAENEIIHTSKSLMEKVLQAGSEVFPTLPKQLSHGDFWDNNVLFKNGQVALIADFDFMGERRRIEDISLTLYFAHISEGFCQSKTFSRERALELKQLLDLYENGLDIKLSEAEKSVVPICIAMQAFWGIGGWVVQLDNDDAARNHAAGMKWELDRCKYVIDNLDEWQDIFHI